MKLYQDVSKFHVNAPVVTIGSFDGVHLGHCKILERLNFIAQEKHGESVVVTFNPHPRLVLFPHENDLQLLNTKDEKTMLLEKAGIQHLIFYPFTKEFAKKSYTDFVSEILVEQLKIKALVVGHDHRFGNNREGSFQFLQKLSTKYNFILERVEAMTVDQSAISSTAIRKALEKGDLEKANRYLGYTFNIQGTVIEGVHLGRKIQFPTANIEVNDPLKIIPANGVYAVRVFVNNIPFRGMLNIGIKPTVNTTQHCKNIEVHLLDFSGNLYHQVITIEFIKKLRDEIRFSSIEELKNQLIKDKESVTKLYF